MEGAGPVHRQRPAAVEGEPAESPGDPGEERSACGDRHGEEAREGLTLDKRLKNKISFEIDDFDRFLVDEVFPASRQPGRWAAMNAVRHTNRAWMLRESDPQMAAFRAITGEEESATALFRALQRLKYPKAEKLKRRCHVHKNAVTPFLAAVWDQCAPALNTMAPAGFSLSIDKKGRRPLLVLKLHKMIGGVDHAGEARPPLGLRVTEVEFREDGTIDPATEKPHDFEKKIAEHAASEGAANVLAYLEKRANLRNIILYAADNGIPLVRTPIEPFLRLARRNTFLILKLFLLVDGYQVQQSFARQCLLAFLKMLGRTDVEVTFD